MKVSLYDLIDIYENEVKKNVRNKKKLMEYDTFYFLKLDMSKYFYTLDHHVIISKIEKDLTPEELNLVKILLDSTNKPYVNKKIKYLENKYNVELPKYEYGKGLAIGNLSSQFLAILYLSDLQYYITNNLRLSFISYMDDYILMHESKDYLKKSLVIIKDKLENEYMLKLNEKKTNIFNCKQEFEFLGYTFKVVDKKTIIKIMGKKRQMIRKGIKRANYLYKNNYIKFN